MLKLYQTDSQVKRSTQTRKMKIKNSPSVKHNLIVGLLFFHFHTFFMWRENCNQLIKTVRKADVADSEMRVRASKDDRLSY